MMKKFSVIAAMGLAGVIASYILPQHYAAFCSGGV